MLQLPRGCMMPGVGKQSSGPGLTTYSAPGLFAPRVCEVWDQPHAPSCRGVQRSETPGTSSLLPWVIVPATWLYEWLTSGQGLLPCVFLLPESGLVYWNAIKMLVLEHKM